MYHLIEIACFIQSDFLCRAQGGKNGLSGYQMQWGVY